MNSKIALFASMVKSIFSPMPLNDFNNYDGYWAQRSNDGLVNNVLPRHKWIADRIPDGASAIDIGCGDGSFLAYLRSRNPASSLFGADISAVAIARLKERKIEGVRIDGTKPLRELAGRDFDFVTLMEVLEHTVEAEALFTEALAFNPKRIFVTIPNTGFIMYRLRLMFGGRFPVTTIVYHMKEHVRFWTVKDFKQWAAAVGCKVTACAAQEGCYNPLIRFFHLRFPALFASQVIYEIIPFAQPTKP